MARGAALYEAQTYIRDITLGELRSFQLGRDILIQEGIDPDSEDNSDRDCPLAHPFYWGAWICQGDTTTGLAIETR